MLREEILVGVVAAVVVAALFFVDYIIGILEHVFIVTYAFQQIPQIRCMRRRRNLSRRQENHEQEEEEGGG